MLTVSDDCYRCGDCIKACPAPGTITNILPGRVRINSATCTECNHCVAVCRFGMITNTGLPIAPVITPPEPVPLAPVVEPPATQTKREGRRRGGTRK